MLARLKMVEKRKDRNVVETVYETRNTKTNDGSAKINKFPYVRMNVRTAEENVIMMKLSINQAIQNTPFVNPITFIVSGAAALGAAPAQKRFNTRGFCP